MTYKSTCHTRSESKNLVHWSPWPSLLTYIYFPHNFAARPRMDLADKNAKSLTSPRIRRFYMSFESSFCTGSFLFEKGTGCSYISFRNDVSGSLSLSFTAKGKRKMWKSLGVSEVMQSGWKTLVWCFLFENQTDVKAPANFSFGTTTRRRTKKDIENKATRKKKGNAQRCVLFSNCWSTVAILFRPSVFFCTFSFLSRLILMLPRCAMSITFAHTLFFKLLWRFGGNVISNNWRL